MQTTLWGLLQNAAMLLSLAVVYEISNTIPGEWKAFRPINNGLIIGFIGILVMLMPVQLAPGILFDSRSILISVTALTFGSVPAFIASGMTIVFRIIRGGVGMPAGVAIIVASLLIGLVWHQYLRGKITRKRWLNAYLFGVCVQAAQIGCLFLLPWPTSIQIVRQVAFPLLAIFPVFTSLLHHLLRLQRNRINLIQKLNEAEGQYKSLFNENNVPMLMLRPSDGQIVDANPAACQFYGWDNTTFRKMNVEDISIYPVEEIVVHMANIVQSGGIQFITKHRIASGELVHMEVFSGPITIDNEVLLYAIIHDISKRIAFETQLRESENRFRSLVEGAPDAIYIQSDLKFVYVNKAAVELFGATSADQLLGFPTLELHPEENHELILQRIQELYNGRTPNPPKEEVFIRLDGTPVDVEVKTIAIQYGDKNGIIVFCRDISKRREAEKQRARFELQLRQQQKLEAIGTLAGGVAHEINNPINGIMNYAELILDHLDKSAPEAEYAKEILHESDRIAVIVRSLLQFSRQEKQSHSYAGVYDIVNQTVSLINTIIRRDQITLQVQMDENLPEIKCRSQQIQQVLMNFLTNARDALNEKYPGYHEDKTIQIRCHQFEKQQRRWIRIVVEDHGNGIPEELQEKIFEPFFSTKPKEAGTGLGLAISFGIVRDHHGQILVESQEGLFTKCILELPVDNGWTL